MKKLVKYLPDFLIQIGTFIFVSSSLIICTTRGLSGKCYSYENYDKLWGIMLITIGLNIILRRYLINKK